MDFKANQKQKVHLEPETEFLSYDYLGHLTSFTGVFAPCTKLQLIVPKNTAHRNDH